MSVSETAVPITTPMADAIGQARAQAREQLAAAWQLYAARVEEQLRSGWQHDLDRLLEERFTELSAAVDQLLSEQARARSDLSERLNQLCRRLRQAVSQQDWSSALLDGASAFCARAAVFTLQGQTLRLETGAGIGAEVALRDAPAFAGAVQALDPLVAEATSAELSEALLAVLGVPSGRVFLFPISSHGRAVGVLFAEEGPGMDTNALELLATVSGSVWESRAVSGDGSGGGLVRIQGAPRHAWSELPPEEQDLHLRAQRFARVQVAEMRLYKSGEVKQGRATQALYHELREDINRCRESYREQFLGKCGSMVDYFHVELVRTLANEDASLLGPDYPGPLV